MRALGPYGAGLLAHVAFWVILAFGIFSGELWLKRAGLFALAWFAGVFVLPYVVPVAALAITPYVALLDIVLVFIVFNGDVRLS